MSTEGSIDNVSVEYLDMALRMVGITFDPKTISRIIDLVALIEVKGDQTSIEDIYELQAKWQESHNTFIQSQHKTQSQPIHE